MAFVMPPDRWPAKDEKWEPPYVIVHGITKDTCGSEKITMSRAIFPEGCGNQYHIHDNAEAFGYLVRGRFRNEFDGHVVDIKAGDFWHFALGENHWSHNLSESEPDVVVACYVGCNSLEGSRTRFLDPATAPALSKAPKGKLPEPGVYTKPGRSKILPREQMKVETDRETGVVTTWGATRENTTTTTGISCHHLIPAGKATPLTTLENAETAAFVLEGKIAVEAGPAGQKTEATAGSFVYIPKGEASRFVSIGDVPASVYVVISGASHPSEVKK